MKKSMIIGLVLGRLCLCVVSAVAQAQTGAGEAEIETEIHVVDLTIISTNCVILGTNAMSLVAATNTIAACRDMIDIIAVHGSMEGKSLADAKSSTVAKIARVGIPLVIVEKDGEYAWREHTGADGVRTVRIGTGQFAALRRLWKGEKRGADAPAGVALRSALRWDTETGTYDFSQVELGLFGERVWLIHEFQETDDESGTIGIQIKKQW